MIVAGCGVGMINPPLASTAVGVVTADKAGMASGINSTFRQVGIATGIALLGTVFSSHVKAYILDHASSVPGLAGRAAQLSTAVQSGSTSQALDRLPPPLRAPVGHLAKSAFTNGLNVILLVGAIISLTGAVITFFSIRSKDFVQYH
jgi:predicted MFS family arabinose efflux permease